MAEGFDSSIVQQEDYLSLGLLGVQLRNANTVPEGHRENPPRPVDSDVVINPGLDNLPSSVGWITGLSASRNQQGNNATQQPARSELFSQTAGSDAPWIFNSPMSGVRRRYVNATYIEQRDNPAHVVETNVAIHPVFNNQANAVGGVTEFSTSNDPQINDAVQQHMGPSVSDQDLRFDRPSPELPKYKPCCVNPRHKDYGGSGTCYSDSALNVSWEHNTDNQPSSVRRVTKLSTSNDQQITDAVQQHVGLTVTDQNARCNRQLLEVPRYRPFGRWSRCVNPRHIDCGDNRSCYSDSDLNFIWEPDTDNQPSTVRRVTEFKHNTRDGEACSDHTTSEPYGLVSEVGLIVNDCGTGLRRLVMLQVNVSVQTLKQAMEQTVNIPAERQVWLFKGVEVRDTDSLAMIGFRSREAIEVLDRELLPLVREKTVVKPLSI